MEFLFLYFFSVACYNLLIPFKRFFFISFATSLSFIIYVHIYKTITFFHLSCAGTDQIDTAPWVYPIRSTPSFTASAIFPSPFLYAFNPASYPSRIPRYPFFTPLASPTFNTLQETCSMESRRVLSVFTPTAIITVSIFSSTNLSPSFLRLPYDLRFPKVL